MEIREIETHVCFFGNSVLFAVSSMGDYAENPLENHLGNIVDAFE